MSFIRCNCNIQESNLKRNLKVYSVIPRILVNIRRFRKILVVKAFAG